MSYITVSSTCHTWLCCISTDKISIEKQEEIKALQMEIKLLNVQLKGPEREESRISQLMEKKKSK